MVNIVVKPGLTVAGYTSWRIILQRDEQEPISVAVTFSKNAAIRGAGIVANVLNYLDVPHTLMVDGE